MIECWRGTSSRGIEGCMDEGGKEGKKGKARLHSATVYSGFVILALDRRLRIENDSTRYREGGEEGELALLRLANERLVR